MNRGYLAKCRESVMDILTERLAYEKNKKIMSEK